jgi:glucokinase
MSHTIGFDLGGTKMMACVFDEDFKIVGRSRKKTKGHEGPQAGLVRITETIKEALDEAKRGAKDLDCIGISIPGVLDLDKGVLETAPNLGWKNVNIRSALESEFKCTTVISNDVDSGVYGEYRFGAAKNSRCVVGLFPGTGIGGGCVYEGKIFRGKSASCMEIGHIQLMPKGPLCGCGQKGCLEALASRLAISSAVAAAAFRGDAPHLMEIAGTDLSDIRSGTLADAIKAGDKVVEQIVRSAAKWLGVGVSVAVNMLAPDIIVLGGGLVEAMPDLFVEEVEKVSRQKVMSFLKDEYKITVARLGDDASAIGAASWAFDSTVKKAGGK